MKALGEVVTDLPGMAPCATSIVCMVRQPLADAWPYLRTDPAALLWIAQHSQQSTAVQTPSLLGRAAQLLESQAVPFVDWRRSPQSVVYQTCIRQALFAERIAEHIPKIDTQRAWTAAFLAPLGWLATAAVQPDRIQSQALPFDHNATTRRLCRSWQLPAWLAQIIGNLGLPVGVAQGLGADRVLFQIVQLSVALCANGQSDLRIAVGGRPLELRNSLGLDAAVVDAILDNFPKVSDRDWRSPYDEPLLPDLIAIALEKPKSHSEGNADRLEQEIDALHRAVHQHAKQESNRLHKQKMDALAEFAAGAGHEINNPLAVISGQAQYLLRQLAPTEPEHDATPEEQEFHNSLCGSLQTIVGQTERIHRLLHNIIQFARPTKPQPQPVDGLSLLAETVKQILPLAKRRKVELRLSNNTPPFELFGDPKQLRTTLVAVMRNAIEAAPENGWASLQVSLSEEWASLTVEDNGPGLTPLVRRHMFDPFFCGRSAGRGNGLGLPVAWKLAQLNQGALCCDESALPSARFVLQLPLRNPNAHFKHEPTRNGFHHFNAPSQLTKKVG